MGSVSELSHTADVGFEVRADGFAELFGLAAEGLTRARGAAPDRDAAARTEVIELRRPDLERLLVAWLRELLYRAMRDDSVGSASVEEVRAPGPTAGGGTAGAGPADGGTGAAGDAAGRRGPARLRARVSWRPAADAPVREIKGVTYHGLAVRRDAEGRWHARVVLDV